MPADSTVSSARTAGALPEQFGRYRVVKQLGKGGMGTVYLAHDTALDRPVALKVPHFGSEEPEMLERFHREARAAAALHHPNLCPSTTSARSTGPITWPWPTSKASR